MRKLISAVLAVLTAFSMLPFGTAAASAGSEAAASDLTYYKGVFYYRPGEGEMADLSDSVDYYAYSDDYFRSDGRVFNEHLSTLSMALSEASVSSTREPFTDEGYARKNRDVIALLEDMGFSDIEINEDYRIKPAKDTFGVACAHKRIVDGGRAYTMLVIVPRSAGYEMEWGNNFVLGGSGDAAGFSGCAEKCVAFARDYVAEKGISGDIKVWTVGYSRGAATVDLLARKLIDDPNGCLGDRVTLTSDNLYAYTFGTPQGADASNDPRNERYAGIFNTYSNSEISSAMAPPEMGFTRCGTDLMIKDDSKKEDMLRNLEICNPALYDEYIHTKSSYHFSPKKFGFSDGSVTIVNDEDSYIPDDPAVYLQGLGAYLTQITGGRESFAENYEQAFSDFIGYYRSLNGKDSADFGNALISSDETPDMVVAMYAYFMKQQSKGSVQSTRAQLLEKTKEISALAASEDSEAVGLEAKDIVGLAAKLGKYLLMDADDIKPIAAQYLGAVLMNALTVTDAPQEYIDKLTSPDALDALTFLLSHIFLGNIWQSKQVKPLQVNNEQMKNAATLAGNFTNIMYDHVNEVYISWIRLSDSYFDDYQALTDEQIGGYRRIYLKTDDATELNGAIYDGEGSKVGVIKNGVLTGNTDKWVGFTSTDDGSFFRIPTDDDYQLRLNSFKGSLTAGVGEYSCSSAQTDMVFEDAVSVGRKSAVTLTIPALDQAGQTAYSLSVDGSDLYGDANGDDKVDILDVTAVQRHVAESELITGDALILADVNCDGVVDISDATLIQEYLAEMDVSLGVQT